MKTSRRRNWFLVRMIVYLTVIAVLLVVRGGVDWRRILGVVTPDSDEAQTLVISGRDLAPELVDAMVDNYRRDYPDLDIRCRGGGTNLALEDLINGRADVALLYRHPTTREQSLFRASDGDTAIVYPIAVAGIVLLAGSQAGGSPLSLDDLRALARGEALANVTALYVPEPNQGLWDAFRDQLPVDALDAADVIFMADEAAVVDAVRNDAGTLGLASAFTTETDLASFGLRAVPLTSPDGNEPVRPTYENVAEGKYPLYHYLYVACRTHGGIQGGKFLTHVSGSRGQRQIERAGYLPALQVLREIILKRSPVGD